MTMLAQKHSSPVIQVTVKQTETNPGLIGVVSDHQTGRRLRLHKRAVASQAVAPIANVSLNCLPSRGV